MSDETLHLKAELYDLNKRVASLASVIDQIAGVLAVSSIQALYEEIVRLKQLDVPEEILE